MLAHQGRCFVGSHHKKQVELPENLQKWRGMEVHKYLTKKHHLDYVRELGSGSFGSVYLYKDRNEGDKEIKQYAVKVIDLKTDKKFCSLTMGEVTSLMDGTHPHVLETHYLLANNKYTSMLKEFSKKQEVDDVADKSAYQIYGAVSEYIDGKNVSELLNNPLRNKKFAPFPLSFCAELAASIGTPIAKALAFLHEKGLVYRDVKPENIMIEREGLNIKLIDFGLSKYLSKHNTEPAEHCGSPAYMAPELLDKHIKEPSSVNADMWSFGAMLLGLSCGCTPSEISRSGRNHGVVYKKTPDGYGRDIEDISVEFNRVFEFSIKSDQEKKVYLKEKFPDYFKELYSDELLAIIAKLTRVHPKDRISAAKAVEELEPLLLKLKAGRLRAMSFHQPKACWPQLKRAASCHLF